MLKNNNQKSKDKLNHKIKKYGLQFIKTKEKNNLKLSFKQKENRN